MKKVFATDDHTDLIKAAGGQMYHFFERDQRMTKSASEVFTRDLIQENMPPDDHFGVQLISMGMEEDFGPNRNGDSASRASLNKYHDTFTKYARVYREHANRDPRKGCGDIKAAKINDKSSRGELLVWVSKDKAPDMYKAAKEGKELSWSMSMRLPHDRCSCCDKKSKRTTDYCSHLKNNMLQYVPEFRKYAYARNEDDVKFIDMSEVKKRADRIATYLRYFFPGDEGMSKAASAGEQIITGSDWAEYMHGPDTNHAFNLYDLATLREMEKMAEHLDRLGPAAWDAAYQGAPTTITKKAAEVLSGPDFRSTAGELCKEAMLLDFESFAAIITGKDPEELEKEAGLNHVLEAVLPTLLADMVSSQGCGCGEELADMVSPDDIGCMFTQGKDEVQSLMDDLEENNSMKGEPSLGRTVRVTIVKQAAHKPKHPDAFYTAMAQAYGCYLVKSATRIKDLPGVEKNRLLGTAVALLSNSFRKRFALS